MLAIELIEDFENLIDDDNCPMFLSKENIQEILNFYRSELGNDKFGDESNKARIDHFYQSASALNQHYKDFDLEIYKAANSSGQSAMRATFLINGGASIALAAFLGTLSASEHASILPSSLAAPLAIFASGSFAAAVAFGAAYMTQLLQGFTNESEKWRAVSADTFNIIAIGCGIGSYTCFGLGLYLSYFAMTA